MTNSLLEYAKRCIAEPESALLVDEQATERFDELNVDYFPDEASHNYQRLII